MKLHKPILNSKILQFSAFGLNFKWWIVNQLPQTPIHLKIQILKMIIAVIFPNPSNFLIQIHETRINRLIFVQKCNFGNRISSITVRKCRHHIYQINIWYLPDRQRLKIFENLIRLFLRRKNHWIFMIKPLLQRITRDGNVL